MSSATMTSINTEQRIIEQNSNDANGVSLCIPFVYKNVTKMRVFAVIKNQMVGHIERIDMVDIDEKHNRVFIHFTKNKWGGFPNYNATDVMMNLKAGIPWVVPYSRNGYWKIWISNVAKPEATQSYNTNQMVPRVKRKQRLDLSLSLSSDTVKNDYQKSSPISLDLNDPIQARIYASMPVQCQ